MNEPQPDNANALHLLAMMKRAIDYQCAIIKQFYDECANEGNAGSELQAAYAQSYNQMVALRARLTLEWLEQMQSYDGHLAMTVIPLSSKI